MNGHCGKVLVVSFSDKLLVIFTNLVSFVESKVIYLSFPASFAKLNGS